MKLQHKSAKLIAKSPVDPKFGLYKSTTAVPNAYKIPQSNAFKGESNSATPTRKISPQEIQFQKTNRLCFKCGECFGIGHQCKNRQLNLMVADEKDEGEFLDAVGKQDEKTGNPGELMDVSLHALTEVLKRNTITLKGEIKGVLIYILVDTGSSDTYIGHHLAKSLDLP